MDVLEKQLGRRDVMWKRLVTRLILCNDARPLVKAEQSLLVKDINELFKQWHRKSLDMYFIKRLHFFIRD